MTTEARGPHLPEAIRIRGARVHNLKNIDVDVPLHQLAAIAGVSGSGKSSLALGVLYAEGSRRYLEALSTYTRRRMTQAQEALVDEVRYVPAALALHQRPGVPGIRSTFGTSTELLNTLRLLFSRLASHRCPNGHYLEPTLDVAAGKELICPVCGAHFAAPGAEELAFNSGGACEMCGGTGITRVVDESTLVPDESLSIDEGAVAPWNSLMWSLMKDVAREMGVRTDVPFCELTAREREIVFHGPAEKKHILYQNKSSNTAGELDFTYYNAVYTVENALAKVKDEKGLKRVEKFLKQGPCPACGGSRLSEAARAPRVRGISLAQACRMTLSELTRWTAGVPDSLPEPMRPMARSIVSAFEAAAARLISLGLSYLSLDRAASTLSTGERQRMQLARAVRNRTTGVLYVLDEPSIGLHPANIEGLRGVMRDLLDDGNSIVLVDHDTQLLAGADYMIEMGPAAGADGGRVIAQGTVGEIEENPVSLIGPYLSGKARVQVRKRIGKNRTCEEPTLAGTAKAPAYAQSGIFALGEIALSTGPIHTVQPLTVRFPKGRMTAVTGVSGSGKTTLILESLLPALEAAIAGKALPPHIRAVSADGVRAVKLIDSTPIGINVRSTVATYANIHDELRRVYARTPEAKRAGLRAGDFSYNTGKLRCPTCDGTGEITLDVQFLPDVEVPCPDCGGSRYGREAGKVRRLSGKVRLPSAVSGSAPVSGDDAAVQSGDACAYSLPELMAMSVDEAAAACADLPLVHRRLEVLRSLGLGYLTLGEATPSLSGGEAQRLKLAEEMGRGQEESVFIFDEPTIGLHPRDVRTLLEVFDRLVARGATVLVIEHDLDVIANADYVVDLGPGGGAEGGRIVAAGTPEQIAANPASVTGRYLRRLEKNCEKPNL